MRYNRMIEGVRVTICSGADLLEAVDGYEVWIGDRDNLSTYVKSYHDDFKAYEKSNCREFWRRIYGVRFSTYLQKFILEVVTDSSFVVGFEL